MHGQITEALRAHLGQELGQVRWHRLRGGSINEVARLETQAGRFVAKWNSYPLEGQFHCESAGLEAMIASATTLTIPRPILATAQFLVLEELRAAPAAGDFDERLGEGLAAMHRHTSTRGFGLDADNYCGASPQPNPWTASWIAFYREHRLRHHIELAAVERGWDPSQRRTFDELLACLDDRLATDDEPPALIHGDLWRGNLHRDQRGLPALIDPAVYYAHREAELGMMTLFGGFARRTFEAYDHHWPLQPGWRERSGLYELYHVLNHYVLFAGSYGAQAVAIAKRYL